MTNREKVLMALGRAHHVWKSEHGATAAWIAYDRCLTRAVVYGHLRRLNRDGLVIKGRRGADGSRWKLSADGHAQESGHWNARGARIATSNARLDAEEVGGHKPSPAAIRHAHATVVTHRMMRHGYHPAEVLGDDVLFDVLDPAWEKMDDEERTIARLISGDLYQISGEEIRTTFEGESWTDALADASGDPIETLSILATKACTLSESTVAWLRAYIYRDIGYEMVAREFDSFAQRVIHGVPMPTNTYGSKEGHTS